MAVWTEEERAEMITTDDFAETVYYLASFGNADVIDVWAHGLPVSAVFTDSYKGIDLNSGTIATSDPMLHFSDGAILTLMQTDRFVVGTTAYDIINIEPDGTGLTLVRLKKA